MQENTNYAGEFSVTHGMGTTTFKISVEDKLSGARFVEFTMDAKDLMLALTGLSHLPCGFELRGLDLVGKRHESKRVLIPGITTYLSDEEFLDSIELVRPIMEIDGWKMDEQRHFNGNMLRGSAAFSKGTGPRDGYEVILRRYVEVK